MIATAQADLASGLADAISFGRPFIATPDLVRRLHYRAPLNEPQRETFYTQGLEGYVDYPSMSDGMCRCTRHIRSNWEFEERAMNDP